MESVYSTSTIMLRTCTHCLLNTPRQSVTPQLQLPSFTIAISIITPLLMCTVVLLATVDFIHHHDSCSKFPTYGSRHHSKRTRSTQLYTLLQDHQAVEKLAGRTILIHDHYFTTAWFCLLQQKLVYTCRISSSQLVALQRTQSALCSVLCHLGKKLATQCCVRGRVNSSNTQLPVSCFQLLL